MSTSLRVSLDVSAVPDKPAGAGRYIVTLAQHLSKRPDLALSVITRKGDAGRWMDLLDGASSSCDLVPIVPDNRVARLGFERLAMSRVIAKLNVDVHHSPHYTMPAKSKVPVVVSIMDMTFFDHPEFHERAKVAFFQRAITRAASEATGLICISEFTAQRLRERVGASAPITVARLGVDLERFSATEPLQGEDDALIRACNLDPSWCYIVFVSTFEPRKGLIELLRAFDRLGDRDHSIRLVLVGQRGWHNEDIDAAFSALRHSDRVHVTGYVDDATLPALLRRAVVVAYPSHAEGFGLPALEALACGTALITTSGTVMEELCGDAAFYVPAGQTDRLFQALDFIIDEDQQGPTIEARRRRGLEIARAHTWEACVDKHVEAYRAALGGNPAGPIG